MSAYIKWSAEFSAVILWWVLDSFDYSPAYGCVNECHVQVIVALNTHSHHYEPFICLQMLHMEYFITVNNKIFIKLVDNS